MPYKNHHYNIDAFVKLELMIFVFTKITFVANENFCFHIGVNFAYSTQVFKKILTVVFLAAFLTICLALDISSNDPIEYVDERGELVAKGEARIATEKFVIQADEIKFQKEALVAEAKGNVKIDNGKIYALSDYVSYEMPKEFVYSEGSKIKVHDFYFYSETLKLSPDLQEAEGVRVYNFDPERKLAPSCKVKKISIEDASVVKMDSVKFLIGKFPIAYLPKAEVRIADRPFYLEPNFGANHTNGAFLQNDFYFGVKKDVKVGGLLDFYIKRGILFGPAIKIDHNTETNKIFTETKFGFIRDGASQKERGTGINNEQIERDRHFLEFVYKQHYGDRLDLISSVSWMSDSEVERDFRKSWFERNQLADSFVEVAYRGDNYILSAFGRGEPNNFYNTTQRLPEVRFDYLPMKFFGTKIINSGYADIVRLHSRDKIAHEKDSSYRSDIYYGMSLPVSYNNFITIKPLAGVRCVSYSHNVDGGNYATGIVQAGFDIDLKFAGRSDYKNEAFGINGLKHTITPTLQYRIIPTGNTCNKIPVFDTEFFNTEMPLIDLSDMRNIDHLERQNMVRLGIRNNLYTKTSSYVPRKLIQFDVFQDVLFAKNYDRFRNCRQKKFPDSYIVFGVYPANWLKFNSYARIDLSRLTLSELKTSVSIYDSNFWKLSFGSNFLKDRVKITEQYNLTLTIGLTSSTSVSMTEKYDAKIRKFSEQRFSLSTTLWNSWLADVGVTLRENAKREDRFQFDWHLRLLDF